MHGYNLHQWATIVVSMIPLTSGIALLSVAITKQEIAVCLAFPSTRSEMPALGMAKWQESLVSDICQLYFICYAHAYHTALMRMKCKEDWAWKLFIEMQSRNLETQIVTSNIYVCHLHTSFVNGTKHTQMR